MRLARRQSRLGEGFSSRFPLSRNKLGMTTLLGGLQVDIIPAKGMPEWAFSILKLFLAARVGIEPTTK